MFIHIEEKYLIHLQSYSHIDSKNVSITLPADSYSLMITGTNKSALTVNNDISIIPESSWKIIYSKYDTELQIDGPLNLFVLMTNQAGITIDNRIFPIKFGSKFHGLTIPSKGEITHRTNIQLLIQCFQSQNVDNNLGLYQQEVNYTFNLLLINISKQFIHKIQHSPTLLTSKTNSKFEEIERYIADHIHERLSIADIAQKFRITPEYLTTLFQKNESMSTIHYIHFLKISSAKDLLIRTTMSVKQVALYFGFTNIKYFYRLFKKETGITPSEYRRLFQERTEFN
ncbi:helix-turn-helix domain-containing protein [Levilactobacillus parabrevis]|uniref:helix-turn-helix domain-containing protein n=1 Tax=Levilactobacillus parabrevis TaxID=357278 RepID=UPI0021A8E5C4|nr:AraC family transcriptional regulator [Levilactobacillus parabrevis]MCT4488605.1 AraC family transcriptional regulator [Levilactobacillus parabrevis]